MDVAKWERGKERGGENSEWRRKGDRMDERDMDEEGKGRKGEGSRWESKRLFLELLFYV
jgi:hypothetical protein